MNSEKVPVMNVIQSWRLLKLESEKVHVFTFPSLHCTYCAPFFEYFVHVRDILEFPILYLILQLFNFGTWVRFNTASQQQDGHNNSPAEAHDEGLATTGLVDNQVAGRGLPDP